MTLRSSKYTGLKFEELIPQLAIFEKGIPFTNSCYGVPILNFRGIIVDDGLGSPPQDVRMTSYSFIFFSSKSKSNESYSHCYWVGGRSKRWWEVDPKIWPDFSCWFDFSGQMFWVILSTFLPIVNHHSSFFLNICVCLPLSCHFKQVEAYPLKVNSPTLNHQVVYQSVCLFFPTIKDFQI